jgi:hypothetical protein
MAGSYLDPWEEFVLRNALGERADGKWAAFEVGRRSPAPERQGRDPRGPRTRRPVPAWRAADHPFGAPVRHVARGLPPAACLIEDTPDFDRRVQRVSRSHGEEGIELKNGQRIRFRTRTKGGGRGFTSDCLILDEAMDLPSRRTAHSCRRCRPGRILRSGTPARPSTRCSRQRHRLARVRERGLRGDEPGLAYFEWSVDADLDEADDRRTDESAWADAKSRLGHQDQHSAHRAEERSMDPRTFAVERLGIGAWPRATGHRDRVSTSTSGPP